CCLVPLGLVVRMFEHLPHSDRLAWIGSIAMGLFSSLLVFTFLREIVLASALTVDALWHHALSIDRLRVDTAVGVPAIALLSTAIGFVNARRRAKVVSVDVPIDGLPTALNGLTIVQI